MRVLSITLKGFFVILLVLRTKKVIDCFHRVESVERNLHEYRRPVAHSPVPKARQFKGFELVAILALEGDEACGWINVSGKVVVFALIVANGADKVYGVEMCATFEHGYIVWVLGINL